MSIFEVAPVTRAVIEDALTTNMNDFENAVLYQAAVHHRSQMIVTRNGKDFPSADIPIMAPDELIALLQQRQ